MSNQPPYLPTALGASRTTLLLGNAATSGPYAWYMPQCTISSNPYGGTTGLFGLVSCIAFQYGAVSVVVWFYVPPNGQGAIIGNDGYLYPNSNNYVPAIYIDSIGSLRFGEWSTGSGVQTFSTPIRPGWHMAVWAEGNISSTGAIVYGYLDGNLIGSIQLNGITYTVGGTSPPPSYWYIGVGYGGGWPSYPTSGWAFFNGTIAYVALYNRVLTTSDVLAIYQGVRITSGLVAEYIGNNYNVSTGVWYDSSGNNYNLTTTVVAGQYPPRGCTLWPTGVSGNWINWPSC